MKWTTHLLALALGVALGVTWMSRPRPKPTPPAPAPIEQAEAPQETAPERVPVAETPPVTAAPKAAPPSGVKQAIAGDDISAATKMVQELEKTAPNSAAALEGRASLLARLGDWRNAKVTLKKCLELYPESASCLKDMASTELQIGTEEEQEEAVGNCLAFQPNDPDCKAMNVTVRMNTEDYDEAITILEELIRDNGRYGPRVPQETLDWQMALSLEEAGRDQEAANYFDKACRANNSEACRRVDMMRQGF